MLLKAENLTISLKKSKDILVNSLSFELNQGEILSIVGESGSGKSLTSYSIMRLLQPDIYKVCGSLKFNNKNLITLKDSELRKIRGNDIAMVYQEASTALNPLYTIKKQLFEPFKLHSNFTDKEILEKVIEILENVKIPNPLETLKKYPFELSGGQKQRIVIAMALCMNPKIIIADEPTTALDVTTQMEILQLFKSIREKYGTSIILITHDLGVVAECSDKVIVMYGGQILEESTTINFFSNAVHPYSQGLIKSRPTKKNLENSRLYTIKGMISPLSKKMEGCSFKNRCDYATEMCNNEINMVEVEKNHNVRCILANGE